MPIWLEYRWRDTLFHRMNPIAKMTLLGGIMTYVPLVYDPRILGAVFLLAVTMTLIARIPRWWFIPWFFILLARAWSGFILGLSLTAEGLFIHIPPEIATITAFRLAIPGTPLVYGVTFGGLLWAMSITLQGSTLVLLAYVFIYTTSVSDLIQSLAKFRVVPQSFLYIIMVGYRFIPYMQRMTIDIINAQRLRGWSIDTKNPVKVLRQMQPVAYPIARQVINIIDEVTISSQIRAFGAGRIVPSPLLTLKKRDWVIVILSLTVTLVLLYLLWAPGIWLGWL